MIQGRYKYNYESVYLLSPAVAYAAGRNILNASSVAAFLRFRYNFVSILQSVLNFFAEVMTLIEFLLRLRYLAVVAVLFCILNSIAFLALGVYESFHAYQVIVTGMSWNEAKSAGVSIVESIDTFLVALVLIILALGLTELFLVSDERRDARQYPRG